MKMRISLAIGHAVLSDPDIYSRGILQKWPCIHGNHTSQMFQKPKVTKIMEPNNRGMEDEFYIPTVFVFFLRGENFGEALQLNVTASKPTFENHWLKNLWQRLQLFSSKNTMWLLQFFAPATEVGPRVGCFFQEFREMRKHKNGSWETQKVDGRLQATQDMQNWCQVIVATAVCLIKSM